MIVPHRTRSFCCSIVTMHCIYFVLVQCGYSKVWSGHLLVLQLQWRGGNIRPFCVALRDQLEEPLSRGIRWKEETHPHTETNQRRSESAAAHDQIRAEGHLKGMLHGMTCPSINEEVAGALLDLVFQKV